ncbi:hypothetical protein MHU86_1287 [Fragilaria crotonensis]|nr:hypothetical protein MHU86_1287 [Fragilaria crotonensis]
MFEDRRRLALDLLIAKTTLATLDDANPMVRCEAVFVISTILGKYLPAFLSASEEMTLLKATLGRAANAIVRFVHERLIKKDVKPLKGRLDGTRSKSDHDIQRFLSNVRSPSKGEEQLHQSSSQQEDGFMGSMVHPMSMASFTTAQLEPLAPNAIVKPESTLPVSGFFQWKRDEFFSNTRTRVHFDSMDQLSPRGALRAYLGSRNTAARGICAKIAQYYSCLAPKPMTTATDTLKNDFFLKSTSLPRFLQKRS